MSRQNTLGQPACEFRMTLYGRVSEPGAGLGAICVKTGFKKRSQIAPRSGANIEDPRPSREGDGEVPGYRTLHRVIAIGQLRRMRVVVVQGQGVHSSFCF